MPKSSVQPEPLSPARQQLVDARTALHAADKAAQSAEEPITNLRRLIAGKQQDLAARQEQADHDVATYAAAVASWAASGASGPMPAADGHVAGSQADRNAIEALKLEIQGLESAVARLQPVHNAAVAKIATLSAAVHAAIKDVVLEQALIAGQNRQAAIAAYQQHTSELAAVRAWLLQQRDSVRDAELIRRSIDTLVPDPTVAQINREVVRWNAFAEALVSNQAVQP